MLSIIISVGKSVFVCIRSCNINIKLIYLLNFNHFSIISIFNELKGTDSLSVFLFLDELKTVFERKEQYQAKKD